MKDIIPFSNLLFLHIRRRAIKNITANKVAIHLRGSILSRMSKSKIVIEINEGLSVYTGSIPASRNLAVWQNMPTR